MEAAVRWSPHRQRFLLVDVTDPALTLNEVETLSRKSIQYHRVARCDKLVHFGAFDWSKTDESVVALGLVSGNASLVKLREKDGKSEVAATFRIKQQRKCNSIAFSTQDWLAVAVDKTRSDVCLFIYDAGRATGDTPDAIRRLCAAEIVSSVRFFPSNPQEIVASTQRAFIRLYDLRDGYSGASGNLQATARNVNNIAIDPLDQNYFASAGSTDDPSLTVWDKRWLTPSSSVSNAGAVFDFKPAVTSSQKTTIWSLKYSGQRRGRLAACTSTGELKIFDMVEGTNSDLHNSEYLPTNPYGGHSWSCNRYISQTRSLERPWYDERQGRDKKTRIVAFDWIDDGRRRSEQSILALRPNREVDVLSVANVRPSARITGRQDFGVALEDISMLEARVNLTTQAGGYPEMSRNFNALRDIGTARSASDRMGLSQKPNDPLIDEDNEAKAQHIVGSLALQRDRCKQGYLFDCHKNMKLVGGNSELELLWECIQRFQGLAAEDGMIYSGLDLSFVGISGIWNEREGKSRHRHLSSKPAKMDEAIIGLNSTREIPAFEGHRTNFPEHRQLCLALCGWKFTRDDLEQECQDLIDRELHYQAIVQAVLHGESNIALNLLRDLIRSKTIQNIGLGALLASDSLNSQQKEMCLWMAADTDDAALKALLTYLNTGDWRDVMSTPYLHLGYRMALGLKYLNDTELSNYIQSQTQRAVMNGNLEGVLLTGLAEQGMDLFQTYISRTNDLQTAVLATAFTNPTYVDDVRWDMWKETYFDQMQVWRAFVERSLFTVQHSRMAKTREGKSLLRPTPAQITLKCAHCRNSLARTDGSHMLGSAAKAANGDSAVAVARPAANAGTVCPQCGRHMPRCGICKMWLGTPSPSSTGGARELGRLQDMMARFLTFCVNCGHGFHADHAKAWFARHELCPVPDCRCLCGLQK